MNAEVDLLKFRQEVANFHLYKDEIIARDFGRIIIIGDEKAIHFAFQYIEEFRPDLAARLKRRISAVNKILNQELPTA